MDQTIHPLASDPSALRLLEHSLLDIEELLGADSFTVDGDQVVFRRRATGTRAAVSWEGRMGDWLVSDGAAHWRIVSDQPTVLEAQHTLHNA
jgi:hypothetical protein